MYSAKVIEPLIIHEQFLSEQWFPLVIICDDGWWVIRAGGSL